MFFDSLTEKAFLARSIKLWLVDNQRSSGVAVAGFESYWLEAGSSTSRSPPIKRTLISRKIGPTSHHLDNDDDKLEDDVEEFASSGVER